MLFRSKEQDKCPPNQTKEEEIGNLPDKEFRIMIVKMIQNLEITQGPEGTLNLLAGLDVLGLAADHKGHVLLQGDMAVPGVVGKV